MTKRSITPIGDILKKVIGNIEKEKTISKELIEEIWKNQTGDLGFKHSRPTSLKKKVLTVRVDNSVWMQNLSMKKRGLLKALQRSLGKDRITEIQFKIGEF